MTVLSLEKPTGPLLGAIVVSLLVHATVLAWITAQPHEPALIAGGGASVGLTSGITESSDSGKSSADDREEQFVETQPDRLQQEMDATALPTDATPLTTPVKPLKTVVSRTSSTNPQRSSAAARQATGNPARSGQKAGKSTANEDSRQRNSSSLASASTTQSSAQTATTRNSGQTGGHNSTADGPGNAEISNYNGKVLQHLERHSRQNSVSPGTTRISFTILGDGDVSNVRVARSSGSAKFDRQGIQTVRRAVPLPRPPGGMSRDFNFDITGR